MWEESPRLHFESSADFKDAMMRHSDFVFLFRMIPLLVTCWFKKMTKIVLSTNKRKLKYQQVTRRIFAMYPLIISIESDKLNLKATDVSLNVSNNSILTIAADAFPGEYDLTSPF